MTMPMSSRRSFLSSAAVVAAASASGCAVTAPAAAAICRAAPYVPPVVTEARVAVGEASACDRAVQLAARFHNEHVRFHALPDDSSEEEDSAAYDAWANAAAACYATPPSTLTGALAFVSVMIDRERGLIDQDVATALVVLRDGLAAMVQS